MSSGALEVSITEVERTMRRKVATASKPDLDVDQVLLQRQILELLKLLILSNSTAAWQVRWK